MRLDVFEDGGRRLAQIRELNLLLGEDAVREIKRHPEWHKISDPRDTDEKSGNRSECDIRAGEQKIPNKCRCEVDQALIRVDPVEPTVFQRRQEDDDRHDRRKDITDSRDQFVIL